jgi:hypothetical protein
MFDLLVVGRSHRHGPPENLSFRCAVVLTHLSWAGSPLLDAGDNNRALDQAGVPLAYDQRGAGFGRILNTTVDIGAVEGSRAVAFALTGPVGSY